MQAPADRNRKGKAGSQEGVVSKPSDVQQVSKSIDVAKNAPKTSKAMSMRKSSQYQYKRTNPYVFHPDLTSQKLT